jgi:pimeloyl-ACP methyl ester carboxylesterase
MTDRPVVLIHGGWHGGWHWEEIVTRLERAGVRAFAPTLSGLAERADLAPTATVATHAADVVRVVEENDLHDVVLFAHSYGGMVATAASTLLGDRVADIAYLDAFVPEDGQSVADLLGAEFSAGARAAAAANEQPHLVPPLFGVEDILGWTGERAQTFAARMCGHPLGTLEDPVAVSDTSARKTFIYCNARPLGLVDRHAEHARRSPDWDYLELASPHDAVHYMPAAVAGLIQSLSEGVNR